MEVTKFLDIKDRYEPARITKVSIGKKYPPKEISNL
jgi:hypothetical protein